MINCDGCHHWAHLSCVKLSKRQADAIPIWHCGPCSGRLLNSPGGSADSHSDVPDDMAEKLSFFKINCRLLKRLPKSSRLPVADSLASRMEAALNHPTPHAWWYFMSFSYGILRTPTQSKSQRTTVAASIRQNINNNPPGNPITVVAPSINTVSTSSQHDSTSPQHDSSARNLAKRVMGKCADGDIRAALRLLTTDDTFSNHSPDTILALRNKHPPAPSDVIIPDEPPNMASRALSVDSDCVLAAVRAMPSGSGAGLDGMRPIFMQQLLGREASESGRRLLHALTRLVNLILAGRIPHYVRGALFGASLCALKKKDGGVRSSHSCGQLL